MHHRQRPALDDSIAAVTITTGGGRWNRRMPGHFDRVMAIATIHLQFTSMQLMTKGDRLPRLVANVHAIGMNREKQHVREIPAEDNRARQADVKQPVDPIRKIEFLHVSRVCLPRRSNPNTNFNPSANADPALDDRNNLHPYEPKTSRIRPSPVRSDARRQPGRQIAEYRTSTKP
jgi:hypothetical protein